MLDLVRRKLSDGYELDDSVSRIDARSVHAYLSKQSYWARGRSLFQVLQSIVIAARVVGLYQDDRQVGFARVVSDKISIAYLADVYVLPEHRGRGLGLELCRFAVDARPLSGLKWVLHTADAHELYAKLGFVEASARTMERPRSAD